MSFLSGPLMYIIMESVPTGSDKSANLLREESGGGSVLRSPVRIQGQFIIRARVQQGKEGGRMEVGGGQLVVGCRTPVQ